MRARCATYRTSKFAADMGKRLPIKQRKGNPLKRQRVDPGRVPIFEKLRAQAKSSKFQTPSSNETPSSKLKNRPARRSPRHLIWGLVFEIWNFSGAWGLLLGVSLRSPLPRRLRFEIHWLSLTGSPRRLLIAHATGQFDLQGAGGVAGGATCRPSVFATIDPRSGQVRQTTPGARQLRPSIRRAAAGANDPEKTPRPAFPQTTQG